MYLRNIYFAFLSDDVSRCMLLENLFFCPYYGGIPRKRLKARFHGWISLNGPIRERFLTEYGEILKKFLRI